jgi:hypothetical protein
MNLNKKKIILLAFLVVMGLVLLFQNLNQSVIGDALTKKKSEDYYKLEYALNNGCFPTWLVDTKHSTYEGKDVIKGNGRDGKDEYVFYSDLTAKNTRTGKTATWTCAGIENLDIYGDPLPTDEEMHSGAIYDNGGNIVADENERDENNRILKEEQDEIERQNFTKSRLKELKAYEAQCFIYSTSSTNSWAEKTVVGKIEGDFIYSTSSTNSWSEKTVVGKIEGDFIYSTSSTNSWAEKTVVGKIEGGGRKCATAAAFLLLP